MSTTIKCDRCGKEIEPKWGEQGNFAVVLPGVYGRHDFDICKDCQTELQDAWQGGQADDRSTNSLKKYKDAHKAIKKTYEEYCHVDKIYDWGHLEGSAVFKYVLSLMEGKPDV